MLRHIFGIAAISTLLAACIVLPHLPGRYDALALPLSAIAQVFGVFGAALLVPIGAAWLGLEARSVSLRRSFANASTIAIVLLSAVLIALAGTVLASWSLAVALALVALVPIRALRRSTRSDESAFAPAPLYLVILPLASCVAQLALAGPATERSRLLGIDNSAELVREIEACRSRTGRYPAALAAVHADFHPGVVGIERYVYSPRDDGYDLSFEQPRFLLDDLGTREFVVYNPRGEHSMVSHAGWLLEADPETVRRNQRGHRVEDAPVPGWKSFLFD